MGRGGGHIRTGELIACLWFPTVIHYHVWRQVTSGGAKLDIQPLYLMVSQNINYRRKSVSQSVTGNVKPRRIIMAVGIGGRSVLDCSLKENFPLLVPINGM